jgi:hypothetical protein
MATSAEIVTAVMTAVRAVGKDGVNKHQNFNFRGIDAVVNAVGPALRSAGGFIVPSVLGCEYSQGRSTAGGVLNTVHLEVMFSIYGSEGEPISGTVRAEAFDSGDKATAKCMSVAFRTFMLQVFCLPTSEPDPDADTYKLGDANQVAAGTPVVAEIPAGFIKSLEACVYVEDMMPMWATAMKGGFSEAVQGHFAARKKRFVDEELPIPESVPVVEP